MNAPNLLARCAAFLFLLSFTWTAQAQETVMADLPPATVGIKAFSVTLSGEAEVPGPGAQAGRGRAFVVIHPNRGKVCYALNVSNIKVPTMAHVHGGAAGTAGDPVVNFDLPTNGFAGCVTGVDTKLVEQIGRNPGNFYVNVHNEDFPAGALRGQLSD